MIKFSRNVPKILDIWCGPECNLDCPYCINKITKQKLYKPAYDTTNLLNFLKECKNKFEYITFSGGEPLLHKQQIIQILSVLNKRKLTKDVTFITNGYNIDALWLDQVTSFHNLKIHLYISDDLGYKSLYFKNADTYRLLKKYIGRHLDVHTRFTFDPVRGSVEELKAQAALHLFTGFPLEINLLEHTENLGVLLETENIDRNAEFIATHPAFFEIREGFRAELADFADNDWTWKEQRETSICKAIDGTNLYSLSNPTKKPEKTKLSYPVLYKSPHADEMECLPQCQDSQYYNHLFANLVNFLSNPKLDRFKHFLRIKLFFM